MNKLKAWDEDMVQRKSKAYDDVENFPNKFTANYLFLVNQTESDIPRVNQPSLDLLDRLSQECSALKARSDEMIGKDIPALNKKLWDAGVGAIWTHRASVVVVVARARPEVRYTARVPSSPFASAPEDTFMNLIITLVIGGIIGWLASLVMKTNAQMGLIANVVVGIVGSFLGAWLAGILGLSAGGAIGAYLISVVGAVVLIGLLKAVGVMG